MTLTWNYYFQEALHCPTGDKANPLPVYFAYCYPYSFADSGFVSSAVLLFFLCTAGDVIYHYYLLSVHFVTVLEIVLSPV